MKLLVDSWNSRVLACRLASCVRHARTHLRVQRDQEVGFRLRRCDGARASLSVGEVSKPPDARDAFSTAQCSTKANPGVARLDPSIPVFGRSSCSDSFGVIANGDCSRSLFRCGSRIGANVPSRAVSQPWQRYERNRTAKRCVHQITPFVDPVVDPTLAPWENGLRKHRDPLLEWSPNERCVVKDAMVCGGAGDGRWPI